MTRCHRFNGRQVCVFWSVGARPQRYNVRQDGEVVGWVEKTAEGRFRAYLGGRKDTELNRCAGKELGVKRTLRLAADAIGFSANSEPGG